MRAKHFESKSASAPKVSTMSTASSRELPDYQPPTWEAILRAHALISPRIHRTPVFASASLNAISGAQLFFKCDNLQKTGSFKIRGASNAILSLTDEEAARGIVTQSSGNHGAAVACAAAWRGVPAWIVVPKNAPAVKAKAIEGYGGKNCLLRALGHSAQSRLRPPAG